MTARGRDRERVETWLRGEELAELWKSAQPRPPPGPSGQHDLLIGGARVAVPTIWRAGVWACAHRCDWIVSHLPTGATIARLRIHRPAELCLLALGEHRPTWSEALAWGDIEGCRTALLADPEPELIAEYWEYRDRIWRSPAIPVAVGGERPWARRLAILERMRADRSRRLASPDPHVRATAQVDEMIDGYLHEGRR